MNIVSCYPDENTIQKHMQTYRALEVKAEAFRTLLLKH